MFTCAVCVLRRLTEEASMQDAKPAVTLVNGWAVCLDHVEQFSVVYSALEREQTALLTDLRRRRARE